jgi:hypothetical protein
VPITAQCVAIGADLFATPHGYGQGAGTFQRNEFLYMVCSNPGYGQSTISGNPPAILAQAHVLKSGDGGFTWTPVDDANGPSVSLQTTAGGLTSPMAACYLDADTLLVGYFVWDYITADPVELRFSTFDLVTETWGAETAGGPTSSTVTDLAMSRRAADGAVIFEYDGTETVTAVKRGRVFYVIYNAGWGAETPVDGAQTGSTTHYNMGGVVAGDASRTHLFYRRSTQPQAAGNVFLFQATLTALDVLTAAVQISNNVSAGGGVPPNASPWSFAGARTVAGVTTIFIAYARDSDGLLYFSFATSANTPAFTEQLIGGTATVNAPGIFNAGQAVSVGLVATMLESSSSPSVTASPDLTTWEATTPITLPATPAGAGPITGWTGLGIDIAGSLPSAGYVINTLFSPPD